MLQVEARYLPLFREIGLDADAIFTHDLVKPWRTLSDRENCTLDFDAMDGSHIRWHIKRYPASNARASDAEVEGIRFLQAATIPTIDLVGWGSDSSGRSFVITEDLAGYQDSEQRVRTGCSFDTLIEPTAQLAAKLHNARLHHRDLYLCHFFSKLEPTTDVRLIDIARVKPLPRFFAKRWLVKDLAQFLYSLRQLGISEPQRVQWFDVYTGLLKPGLPRVSLSAVMRKAKLIARHDAKLRKSQPTRNISIPQ